MVLVPGITGVQLRDPESGEIRWGTGKNLLSPRDGGQSLALPLGNSEDPPLEAFAPIREIRISLIRKPVYGPIFDLLAGAGYRLGSFEAPQPGDNLFSFSYDWRKDNVAAARRLASTLSGLREARGGRTLKVSLICQSNGGHICRYLAKYGDTPLEDALEGKGAPPAGVEIDKVIFVGTSNGGSLRILRFLNEGRTYVTLGRKLQPETLFTFSSLFQDLPGYRPDLFLDSEGRTLDVDLFDPASWEAYGWSVFGRKAMERVAKASRPDLFGTVKDRRAFLTRALARGRDLQAALRQDAAGFGESRYFFIQSSYRETPDRALLVKEKGEWRTYFSDQKRIKRDPYLRALAAAPGDGHATQTSQQWLSPQEQAALTAPPFYVDGPHFEMILEPATFRRLLDFLAW
ncbi:MAG: hypothetical protein KDD47_01020 [Acidobacteria bacterium]|nr:hypothetical protein [Acidobacteriota bacterium]